MTQEELRRKIIKRYRIGQIVNMRKYDGRDIIKRFKVEIVRFYPHHVSCLVHGFLESFTYYDMATLTKNKRGDVD